MNISSDNQLGLIHYYYGTGPGKTTTAFGKMLRALGHGFKPVVIQFLKKSTGGNDLHIELKKLEGYGINIDDMLDEDITGEYSDETGGFDYGEYQTITKTLKVPVIQLGSSKFIINEPSKLDLKKAEFGLKLSEIIIQSGKIDVLILDEINTAISLKLIEINRVTNLLKKSKIKGKVEIYLTGREKYEELVKVSDYVVKYSAEKHPYEKKINARFGVEY